MTSKRPLLLAIGGLLAMAAGMGIGRFVYTPILPSMIKSLGWSKLDAGLVASANFLGYLIGAFIAGGAVFARAPRAWLIAALAVSAATTAGMAFSDSLLVLSGLRFASGVASAFVIICSSVLVLEQLAAMARGGLAAVHFAGVGFGIIASAVIVSALVELDADWRGQWIATGATAAAASVLSILLIPKSGRPSVSQSAFSEPAGRTLWGLASAHGLFGFGYVITATFLVTIVRETPAIRSLEPWVWVLVGVAAVPSVPLWQGLGRRAGLLTAYAVACVVEGVSVVLSVVSQSVTGLVLSAVLLGGTFMGLTALGLMAARQMAPHQAQRAIGLTTASFGLGQMVGPTVAGYLSEMSGDLRSASFLATFALMVAALISYITALKAARSLHNL